MTKFIPNQDQTVLVMNVGLSSYTMLCSETEASFLLHVFMSVWVLVLNEFLVVSLTLSSKVIRILKLELQTDQTQQTRQREGKRKEKIRAKQQGHFGCSSSLMILTDGHDKHLLMLYEDDHENERVLNQNNASGDS